MSEKFEIALARILYEASLAKGLVQADMGALAFRGESSPDRKIRSLFDSTKPRSLKASEIYAWATGIGLDPARLVGRALEVVEGVMPMPQPPTSDKPGRKPGKKSLGRTTKVLSKQAA